MGDIADEHYDRLFDDHGAEDDQYLEEPARCKYCGRQVVFVYYKPNQLAPVNYRDGTRHRCKQYAHRDLLPLKDAFDNLDETNGK